MCYQAKLVIPFAVLGIVCDEQKLTGIDFLPVNDIGLAPLNALAAQVCQQLLAYLHDADFVFDVPMALRGTEHQQRVWQAMLQIPRGQTRSYGEIAHQLQSSAQAVGNACGANPIPIIVPCHRIVAKHGLGGFAKQKTDDTLDIKRWLLKHEQLG